MESSLNCSIDCTIFTGSPDAGDVEAPAPRREHLFIQLQNPIGEGIAVPEIVKRAQPVQLAFTQGALDFSHSFCRRLLSMH